MANSIEGSPAIERDPNIVLEKFLGEETVEGRIQIAEDYIQNAEGEWLHMYSHLAPDQVEKRVEALDQYREGLRQEKLSESPIESAPLSEAGDETPQTKIIEAIRQMVISRALLNQSASFEDIPKEILDRADELNDYSWKGFLLSLDIEESIIDGSQPVLEAIDWFKGKLDRNEVIVIDSSGIQDKERREKVLEVSKVLPAPFQYRAGSDGKEGTLIICLDLVERHTTGSVLMCYLAHEKAHEDLSRYRGGSPSDLGMTELVFKEFYPMLEEQRMYESFSAGDKHRIPAATRALYELDEEFEGLRAKGKLPSVDKPVEFEYSQMFSKLALAYLHTMESYIKNERRQVAGEMQEAGALPEDITKRVAEIKAITRPVITAQDLNWVYEKRKED